MQLSQADPEAVMSNHFKNVVKLPGQLFKKWTKIVFIIFHKRQSILCNFKRNFIFHILYVLDNFKIFHMDRSDSKNGQNFKIFYKYRRDRFF